MEGYIHEQMVAARKADLYEYAMRYHGSLFRKEGESIRLRDNDSLAIKRGFSGYKDFANGEHGNSVDFLTRHLNYSLPDAVRALAGDSLNGLCRKWELNRTGVIGQETARGNFILPEPVMGNFKHLYAYLTISRGISPEIVNRLIAEGFIYEYAAKKADYEFYNIAFVNRERDFAEVHGTSTTRSFHGVLTNSRTNGFWGFAPHPEKETIATYVCEAAIDAISLYELHRINGTDPAYEYVSIAGCSKQGAIDRLKKCGRVILAVDNDVHGQECRERNKDLEFIIPQEKDWNEDLLKYKENIKYG